ncbi:A-kinase anchor protein 13 isoform X1 [Osmerus eperlanus]|uniref:A-kinase anchor protein 13 isoform X1 n=1 Tax=Osmerus eperlanus TaxID=29151 RepID=UPI002E0E7F5A
MEEVSSLGPGPPSPQTEGPSAGSGVSGGPWPGWNSTGGRRTAGGGEEEEEERKDKLTEVCPAVLHSSARSLSPFRRHSWGPGKNPAAETEMGQRSSLRTQLEEKPVKPTSHRRSMSWCLSSSPIPAQEHFDTRSYSLEGLPAPGAAGAQPCPSQQASERGECAGRAPPLEGEERGSLVSLTEESDLGDAGSLDSQRSVRVLTTRHSCSSMPLPLTKSISMVTISHRELDASRSPRPRRRISFSFSISPLLPKPKTLFSIGSSSSDEEEGVRAGSFSSTSGSIEYSISEEDPGPLRTETESRTGTKVSRTFSYLKNKMSKKNKEKDKDRSREKEKESKDKTVNGHVFSLAIPPPATGCQHCSKTINAKEAFLCTNCSAQVHKGCRENLPVCAKVKMKQQKQQSMPDTASMPGVAMRTSSLSRERPLSAISPLDDQVAMMPPPRRNPSILSFSNHNPLSKSISISNIAGPVVEDMSLRGFKYLSQSTEALHKTSKINESTESLTDEGTEMIDSQLMGEFEAEVRRLEGDSWSFSMEKKFVKQQKKEVVKRQDVIYELLQTEMHHVRTLRILSEVYSKGLQREVQLDRETLSRMLPVLDELLELHTCFFTSLLERKRASLVDDSRDDGRDDSCYLIRRIGDVLLAQFSGPTAERMKKVYGKFCSRHNEAVNLYKDLHARDKRFQAFIKKKMSSTIVRRLGIPECILLVTQRITKYPVLLQRVLQHTKESEEDYEGVSQALKQVKEVIAAVDCRVNEQEKKRRLKEVYARTDSKSIMRMKSGQMFAREDLLRGRRLVHDGTLQLKNSAGRLKEVQAMLLSDVFVFLQEKDQKFVFASLDQRSTVISLQKLIVREVANEERGLFLITAGIEKPEMVEVMASSREERNTWRQLIQDAMHCIEKDEDEGVPSENEEDRRQLESKAREVREKLRRKDEEIVTLLEEKIHIFRDMSEGPPPDEPSPPIRSRMLFRATPDDVTKGEPIMKDALKEVETLHMLVNSGLGGAVVASSQDAPGAAVCLPRRAETFGGFDSKNGDREEGGDSPDLRRTESDSVLKKGGNTNLVLLKRNNEQVLHSVTHLHDLLSTLQAVVVQQDSYIEDQRQTLSERPHPSRHSSSSSSLSSSSSSRPSSLIEQEKQRSLERQRQEAAQLQRQQAAHVEERRRREREWEAREKELVSREEQVAGQEEESARRCKELEEERQQLQRWKEEYQRDLERLRDAQRKLEREREALSREAQRGQLLKKAEAELHQKAQVPPSQVPPSQVPPSQVPPSRTPSTTSEDSLKFLSSSSLDGEKEVGRAELSCSAPSAGHSFLRMGSKRKGKNLNLFSSSSSSSQAGEPQHQLPSRLLQLSKKDKKDKKKNKGKGPKLQLSDDQPSVTLEPPADGEVFC